MYINFSLYKHEKYLSAFPQL